MNARNRLARRHALWTALIVVSCPLSSRVLADPPSSSRLPMVESTGNDAAIENLFASFQRKRASEATQAEIRAEMVSQQSPVVQRERWLRSGSSTSSLEVARRILVQANQEYELQAWASAETSAWDALRWAAESIELNSREQAPGTPPAAALANLAIARTAIREAREFSIYGGRDQHSVRRIAASHRTKVLDESTLQSASTGKAIGPNEAIDRYLNEARVRLAGLAAHSVEAAQAMDLLAAIYLGRAEARTLPSSTALCLRRAALQGQPGNASLALRLGLHLADLGLLEEARWALEHSIKIEPTTEAVGALTNVLQRSGQYQQAASLAASSGQGSQTSPQQTQVPQVTQLTPQQFAAISRPVMTASSRNPAVPSSFASNRTGNITAPPNQPIDPLKSGSDGNQIVDPFPSETSEPDSAQPSMVKRMWNAIPKPW